MEKFVLPHKMRPSGLRQRMLVMGTGVSPRRQPLPPLPFQEELGNQD